MSTHERDRRHVLDIRFTRGPGSPTQRELVVASLLLRPGKDPGGRRSR